MFRFSCSQLFLDTFLKEKEKDVTLLVDWEKWERKMKEFSKIKDRQVMYRNTSKILLSDMNHFGEKFKPVFLHNLIPPVN